MKLIDTVRADSIQSRKEKDGVASSLLTTLYSEAATVGKNDGNRDTTDAEVVAVVKKFIKGVDETIAYLETNGQQSSPSMAIAVREKELLGKYMPMQLSENELSNLISEIVSTLPDRSQKQMGIIMKQLKESHGGMYDGAGASKLIKGILQ